MSQKSKYKLGSRAEAQQQVLAESVTHYQSWRDVDARIKAVEIEVIKERRTNHD